MPLFATDVKQNNYSLMLKNWEAKINILTARQVI